METLHTAVTTQSALQMQYDRKPRAWTRARSRLCPCTPYPYRCNWATIALHRIYLFVCFWQPFRFLDIFLTYLAWAHVDHSYGNT